jgi:virginiamycin B lyase
MTRRPAASMLALTLIAGCAASPPSGTPAAASSTPTTTPAPTSTPTPTLKPTPTVTPLLDIEAAGATRLRVPGFPDWLALASGSAWVAVDGGVQRLDRETGMPAETIPVGGSICLAMDVGFDSLWVGVCEPHTLVRIDPATSSVVETIVLPIAGIGEEASVGAGEGAVWVASTEGELVKVSPDTNQVVATWPIPPTSGGVRAGLGSVWVAATTDDILLRIDPDDGSVLSSTAIKGSPRFLAVGEGGVWTLDQIAGTVTHVDPSGDLVASIPVSPRAISGGDIAVGGGFVWARIGAALVVKIDPATDTVVERYGPEAGSGSVAADDADVWVSAHDVSAVWRLALP